MPVNAEGADSEAPIDERRQHEDRRRVLRHGPDRGRRWSDDRDLSALHDAAMGPFGQTIYRLRERHGWTQEMLGRAAGINRDTVIAVEQGRVDPRLSTLQRLLFPFGLIVHLQITVATPQSRVNSTRSDPATENLRG
jgi:DNA-binding XRE family transcriptional regulator